MSISLLFLAGSARSESWNKKLAAQAETMASGVQTTFVDLADFEMPLFSEDLEASQGMPDGAKRLKELFIAHHGFLIAAPEYNSSMTPLLKNSLDWISRSESEDEAPLRAYRGKTAALVAASPGGLGGLRGLVPLRLMLSNIGVHVLPDQLAIASAFKAFDNKGHLVEELHRKQLQDIVDALIDSTSRMNS